MKRQAKQVTGVTVTTKTVTVAGHPTLALDYTLVASGVKVQERQYVWVSGSDLVVVTVATRGKPDYVLWARIVATTGVRAAA